MPLDRERRSHVLPPSRKTFRCSIAAYLRREHVPPADEAATLDELLDLPAPGRRAIKAAKLARSTS